jgi:hypothetical protein
MEKREISAKHLHSLAMLLHHSPIMGIEFVKSTLFYIAAWSEGKVDSTPGGPVWHDQEAEATWRAYGGGKDDSIEGEVVSIERIVTDDDCDACNGTDTGQFCRAHDWHSN